MFVFVETDITRFSPILSMF